MIKGLTSDLDFIRKIQVALVASSTTMRKYLKPSIVEVEKGPHTSMCTKSKEQWDMLLLEGKGNLFCLAKGKLVQWLLQELCETGKNWLKEWSLESDGCRSLECHNADKEFETKEIEEKVEKEPR